MEKKRRERTRGLKKRRRGLFRTSRIGIAVKWRKRNVLFMERGGVMVGAGLKGGSTDPV